MKTLLMSYLGNVLEFIRRFLVISTNLVRMVLSRQLVVAAFEGCLIRIARDLQDLVVVHVHDFRSCSSTARRLKGSVQVVLDFTENITIILWDVFQDFSLFLHLGQHPVAFVLVPPFALAGSNDLLGYSNDSANDLRYAGNGAC
jgi:hypothetical protein